MIYCCKLDSYNQNVKKRKIDQQGICADVDSLVIFIAILRFAVTEKNLLQWITFEQESKRIEGTKRT